MAPAHPRPLPLHVTPTSQSAAEAGAPGPADLGGVLGDLEAAGIVAARGSAAAKASGPRRAPAGPPGISSPCRYDFSCPVLALSRHPQYSEFPRAGLPWSREVTD